MTNPKSCFRLTNPKGASERQIQELLRNDKTYIRELAAPDALLGVEGGEHYGFVVDAGGVAVDGGGGLGAEVAVAGVEIESGDVVGAVGAGELHASLDARNGVKAFHRFECSLLAERSDRNEGCAAKVMKGGSSRVGMSAGALQAG